MAKRKRGRKLEDPLRQLRKERLPGTFTNADGTGGYLGVGGLGGPNAPAEGVGRGRGRGVGRGVVGGSTLGRSGRVGGSVPTPSRAPISGYTQPRTTQPAIVPRRTIRRAQRVINNNPPKRKAK